MDKTKRTDIYRETVEILKRGNYEINGCMVETNSLDDYMQAKTKTFPQLVHVEFHKLPRYDTIIKVVDNDCLYEAKKLIDEGLNPAVLNMASFIIPGGGVITGSNAQEENIFRRTNIYKSLYMFHEIGREFDVKTSKKILYPMSLNCGILTPKVLCFRDSEDKDYRLMEKPFNVDVITVAAYKNPTINKNGSIIAKHKRIILSKIKQILNIAILNGNDSIVLSAFGCGAYKTPPEEMAKLFADVLSSEEYSGAFKTIRFAIINLPSTNGKHNKNGNFIPFKNIFG